MSIYVLVWQDGGVLINPLCTKRFIKGGMNKRRECAE